jgi:hypothetical protein
LGGGRGGTRKAEERIQITERKRKNSDSEVMGLETTVTVQPTHSTVIPKPHTHDKCDGVCTNYCTVGLK